MIITDLDYLEPAKALAKETLIKGAAAGAFVAGYASAGTGYASAGALAVASGQQTFGNTNTLAVTALNPYYTTSSAAASGYAVGVSPGSYASAGLFASSDNTSFNGNFSTINSSVTYSTYMNTKAYY